MCSLIHMLISVKQLQEILEIAAKELSTYVNKYC